MDIVNILKICDKNGFHIKEIDKDYRSEIHSNYSQYKEWHTVDFNLYTHYIMKGDNIIFIGNIDTCISFILRSDSGKD